MTLLRFRRRHRPVIDGDFDDDGESVTEILDRTRPADWDGTTITFGGASVGAMDPASAYPPPAPIIVEAVRLRALPPASGPAPCQVFPPVEITEPAVIGNELRLPVIWCEMPRCISWFLDQESLGERDARRRAEAAGWRTDALGRLACPDCQQADPGYRTPQPVAWHHPEVRRRWQSGQRPGEDTTDMLAVEAELGRRISRETPALARDIAAASRRYGHAGGAR